MSKLKIDENHIKVLSTKLSELLDELVKQLNVLKNKKSDIFLRYMALVHLSSVYVSIQESLKLASDNFRMGFDLSHEILQTNEAKCRGWGEIKIENNPLFEQKSIDNEFIKRLKELNRQDEETDPSIIKNRKQVH